MIKDKMNELKFTFTSEQVRVTIIKNEPYFCASDIGNILLLTNVHRQVKSFCDKRGVHTVTTPTKGGNQHIIYVSESNLYRLIFKSRKKEAKLFQDWVVEEVLPTIRKTGKYSIPDQLKEISTKKRNQLTNEWKNHGIEKPHEYIQLTLKEYETLGFKKGKRKKDLNRGELLLLSALESMETLKLFNNEKIQKYHACKNSLEVTAENVKKITMTSPIEIKE
jgi:prophage antirepressor-like protein